MTLFWKTLSQAVRPQSRACHIQNPTLSRAALEKWSLGPADLHPHNPSLIFTRVSGYGQTGPWAKRPGYASVCEAESGFRFINGYPDEETGGLKGAPVRPNISLGDSVAGLHAAFGTVSMLFLGWYLTLTCFEAEGAFCFAGSRSSFETASAFLWIFASQGQNCGC